MTNAMKLLVLLASIGCGACGGGGGGSDTGSTYLQAASPTVNSSDDYAVPAQAGAADVPSSDRVVGTEQNFGLCRE